MKSIFLDTNSYSYLASGNKQVHSEIIKSRSVLLSAVSLGELFAGFLGGDRYHANFDELSLFLNKYQVKICNITKSTAKYYGQIMVKLYIQGTPIPTNDIWIASQALETDSSLITFDKHFEKIPGLRLWSASD